MMKRNAFFYSQKSLILAIAWSFFLIISSLQAWPSIQYESIDFSTLYLCKEAGKGNAYRRVYLDQQNQLFIKEWGIHYQPSIYFQEACLLDYYQELTPLKEIIYDKNGLCRGYVTYAGESPIPLSVELNEEGYFRLKSALDQPRMYHQLYSQIIEKILTTQLVYFDLTPSNVIVYQGKLYLIDLESIYPLKEIVERFNYLPQEFQQRLKYLPQDYVKFLQNLSHLLLSQCESNGDSK